MQLAECRLDAACDLGKTVGAPTKPKPGCTGKFENLMKFNAKMIRISCSVRVHM